MKVKTGSTNEGSYELPPVIAHKKKRLSSSTHKKKKSQFTSLRVALFIIWLLTLFTNATLDILLDLFQGYFKANEFPFYSILVGNLFLYVVGVGLVFLLGKSVYRRRYKLFQPFYGGRKFVSSQAAGYTIGAVALVLKFILIRVSFVMETSDLHYGSFTVVGFFTVVSQLLLLSSLFFFFPSKEGEETSPRGRSHPPNEILFIVICNVVMVVCSAVAEWFAVFRPVNVVVLVSLSTAAMYAVERVAKLKGLGMYHFYFPYLEVPSLFITQIFANALLLLGLLQTVVLYWSGLDVPRGWHLYCAFTLAVGHCVHLIVVRLLFQHRVSVGYAKEGGNQGESFVAPMLASFVNLLLEVAMFIVYCANAGLLDRFEGWIGRVKEGCFLFNKDFKVWQPFSGPMEFILLQCTGWAAYGVLIFFGVLSVSANDEVKQIFVLIYSAASMLSQVCIHTSLYLFESREEDDSAVNATTTAPEVPKEVVESDSHTFSPEGMENSFLSVMMNNEMLVALVLGALSLLIRLVCDALLLLRSPVPAFDYISGKSVMLSEITREAFLSAATFFSFLAPLAAQLSLRRHYVSQNLSNGFAALQTFGWTFYSILLVAVLALKFSEGHISLALQYIENEAYTMWITGEGVLLLIPLLCIVVSCVFEYEALVAQREAHAKALLAVEELKQMLTEKGVTPEESERFDQLLRTIGGPRFAEEDTDKDNTTSLTETARVICMIVCVACVGVFSVAAFFNDSHPNISLLFGVIGVLLLSLSCVSTHVMYGRQFHRHSDHYSYFMPFTGGKEFVALQCTGWVSYSMCVLLMVAAVVEGKASPLTYFILSPLSVVSQISLLVSIPLFKDQEGDLERSFIGRNAEGILAIFTFIGTFFFVRLYEAASEGRASKGADSLLPLTISALSTVFIVPMGLLYINRQTKLYGISPLLISAGLDDEEDEGFSPSSSHVSISAMDVPVTPLTPGVERPFIRRQETAATLWSDDATGSPLLPRTTSQYSRHTSRTVATVLSVVFFLAIFIVSLVPLVFVLWFYMAKYDPKWASSDALTTLIRFILAVFLAVILFPTLAAPFLGKASFLKGFHNATCCYLVYSIPTFTVLSGVLPPFLFSTWGAKLFAFNMCSMALLSTLPYVHLTAFVTSLIAFAYFTQYHFYTCLYQKKEPFVLAVALSDVACAVFWIWYDGRYSGRPEISGRLRSRRWTYVFKHYFFEAMARYFSLKIIVSTRITLEGEQSPEYRPPKVNMRDPENQYLFSFHPHGVFPGSAMYVPQTNLWDHTVGYNPKTAITTHCADIIFSVPLMREFPLVLGAMSVSRKGIEASIKKGHSPLIVTGGQSEMLLTAASQTEMHLVCHHLGFLRLALQHKIPLTPIISFAETNILDNVHCLRVQRWFLKRIAFPFPTLPIGRWGLPLPRKSPTTLVIGQPLLPLPGRDDPNDPACVEELRIRYFEHLEVLFYKYRKEAGYPEMKLFLHNGVYDPGAEAVAPSEEELAKEKPGSPVSWFKAETSAVRRAVRTKGDTKKKK